MRLFLAIPLLLLPAVVEAQEIFSPANGAQHRVSVLGNRAVQGIEYGIREDCKAIDTGLGGYFNRDSGRGEGYAWAGTSGFDSHIYYALELVISAGATTVVGAGVKAAGGAYLTSHFFLGASAQAVAGLRRSYGFVALQAGLSW